MILSKNVSAYYYSQNALRKALRSQDFWKYNLKKESIEKEINRITNFFATNSQKIVRINKTKLKSKEIFVADSLDDTLLLRCTDWILKRGFSLSSFDRNEDIKQVMNLLAQKNSYSIFRTDIKNFFESIKLKEIISVLERSDFYNLSVLEYLTKLGHYLESKNILSLPRGLSISSTLSNIYLQDLDRLIFQNFDVIFYSRYVDDILILTENDSYGITEEIGNWLEDHSLNLNLEKTKFVKVKDDNRNFEYLGYRFISVNGKYEIGIDKKKIDKIKTRICLAIKGFNQDKKYSLLLRRLKFLSGNTEMKIAGRSRKLLHGLRYQYSLSTEEHLMLNVKELDKFYHTILNSKKYSVSRKLRSLLENQQYIELRKISFTAGFERKITNSEDRKSISQIKRIWMHV
ncbi:hypothetical protein EHQ94_11205 [Leptospira meyeri]|uniref:antiviral reverse transcriptase Drt3a n=1 Tax=Leptospira meyeri TaxID=29508 RepID=UPI001083E93A|nr:antiviral reverse transcriptase Drt3a [Leptospira meyeri]TGM66154.1 hypothetical protein EHQ94_11205 [Leptospira meyeri]